MAHGGSQARGSNQSYGCWPMPEPQQCQIQATSVTYTTAQSNDRSLPTEQDHGSNPQPHGSHSDLETHFKMNVLSSSTGVNHILIVMNYVNKI